MGTQVMGKKKMSNNVDQLDKYNGALFCGTMALISVYLGTTQTTNALTESVLIPQQKLQALTPS